MERSPITPTDFCREVTNFSKLLKSINSEFGIVQSEIEELTRESDNLLHMIEREDCKYDDRAKIATQLRNVRMERRKLKDWMYQMRPVFEFYKSDRYNNISRLASSLLGESRKAKDSYEKKEGFEE